MGALRRGGARERRKGECHLAFCATIVAKRSPPSLSLSRPPAPVAPDTRFGLRQVIKGEIWRVAAIIGSYRPIFTFNPRTRRNSVTNSLKIPLQPVLHE